MRRRGAGWDGRSQDGRVPQGCLHTINHTNTYDPSSRSRFTDRQLLHKWSAHHRNTSMNVNTHVSRPRSIKTSYLCAVATRLRTFRTNSWAISADSKCRILALGKPRAVYELSCLICQLESEGRIICTGATAITSAGTSLEFDLAISTISASTGCDSFGILGDPGTRN